MPIKMTTKVSKAKASKAAKLKASRPPKSKSSKAASKKTKSAMALTQKVAGKKQVKRSSTVGKFVSAKTGRVVKASPAKPRLGKDRIKTVVSGYVSRNPRSGRVSK